jgi:hypothetical protein
MTFFQLNGAADTSIYPSGPQSSGENRIEFQEKY